MHLEPWGTFVVHRVKTAGLRKTGGWYCFKLYSYNKNIAIMWYPYWLHGSTTTWNFWLAIIISINHKSCRFKKGYYEERRKERFYSILMMIHNISFCTRNNKATRRNKLFFFLSAIRHVPNLAGQWKRTMKPLSHVFCIPLSFRLKPW